MGSETPDEDLYRQAGLDGGLAYSADDLRWIFSDLGEESPASPRYGVPFLWTALFRRP